MTAPEIPSLRFGRADFYQKPILAESADLSGRQLDFKNSLFLKFFLDDLFQVVLMPLSQPVSPLLLARLPD